VRQSTVIINSEVIAMSCAQRHLPLVFVLVGAVLGQTTAGPNPAQLFEKGMNALTGTGLSRNDVTASDYIRRSAELGYAPAQVTLGYFYETGTILTREPKEGVHWYKSAAQQDDVLGEWLLGRAIFNGETSMRDLNEASDWLSKAAAHNDPFGEYLLGMTRLERNDYPQAAEWFRKAAVQGLPQAQQQLAQLLEEGKGVDVNKFDAYVWLLVSFDAGNSSTAADLQKLEADLGSNQVERAKTKARELESSVARAVVARGCTGWAGEFDRVPSPPPPDLQRFCR
jgi:TPR repeat protein